MSGTKERVGLKWVAVLALGGLASVAGVVEGADGRRGYFGGGGILGAGFAGGAANSTNASPVAPIGNAAISDASIGNAAISDASIGNAAISDASIGNAAISDTSIATLPEAPVLIASPSNGSHLTGTLSETTVPSPTTFGSLGAPTTTNPSPAPLYAEGEEKALSAFQEGMISVQEFATTTLALTTAPRVGATTGIFADAEWLNWRVGTTNTIYGTSYDSTGYIEGSRFALTPNGNGIRARLGYRFDDFWDASFVYVNFDGSDAGPQTSGTVFTAVPSGAISFAASTAPLPPTESGSADVRLSVFDLEFGRRHRCGDAFEYRTFGGLRAGKTYERFAGLYQVSPTAIWNVSQTTKGRGYGLRGGGEARWNVYNGWSVFGSGALSVLVTSIDSTTREAVASSGGELLNYRAKSHVATPVLDVRAGVSWRRAGWEIKGGYELSDWYNVSNLDSPGNDLLFYGYFAGASWNF